MNKYEQIFNEIVNQTKSGNLKWKQLKRYVNSDLIFNPNLIWRQFSTDFERGGHPFTILLVEKKYEDPEFDFAFEKYTPELLVIDDGELVATINDSIIEKNDMLQLANLVETKSDKAQKLFGF